MRRGIVTIVSGIASIRNKMSDAHPRSYKPAKHHAELAVNSVSTICTFLLDTFEYQKKNGTIQIASGNSRTECCDTS